MTPELRELYQELILDHNRKPRNRRRLEGANYKAEGYNPLCGDRVTVYMNIQDGRVKDAAFEGAGCAISTASASLMTESVIGKTTDEVKALFHKFRDLVTGEAPNGEDGPELGKLVVFSGVSQYPARVKCASLVWHTAKAAIEGEKQPVSTE